jgi:hypothetical protein
LSDLRAWLKAHVEQKAVLSGNKNSDWPNCEFLRTISSSFNEKEKHPAQIKLHCILTSHCSQSSVLGLWKHIHWQCQDLAVILNKRRDACFECIVICRLWIVQQGWVDAPRNTCTIWKGESTECIQSWEWIGQCKFCPSFLFNIRYVLGEGCQGLSI